MSNEKHINKSFSANSIFYKTYSSKGTESFSKISPVKIPNTEGESPVIVYKKSNKLPTMYEIGLRESGYITDGGLKKKLQKFDGCKSFTRTHRLLSSSIKQKSTSPNFAGMNKGKYSQSMKNINPKTKTETKISPQMQTQTKNSIIIKNKPKSSSSKHREPISKPRNCMSPEVKQQHMKDLVEKGITSFVQNYYRILNEEKKTTRQEEINQRKFRYLEENGIQINEDNLEKDENSNNQKGLINPDDEYNFDIDKSKELQYDNIDNNLNDNNNEILPEPKKVSKTNRTFSNSVFCGSSHKGGALGESNSMRAINSTSVPKKILKPKIDNFEYVNRINNEMKQITKELHSENNKENNSRSKNSNQLTLTLNHNSFRHSHSQTHSINNDLIRHHQKSSSHASASVERVIQADSKKKQVFDEENNFLFSYQSNHRSEEELAHFIMTKKIIEQEKAEKETLINHEKNLMIYHNLYLLSQWFQQKKRPKKTKQKKRIPNEYYIGTYTNKTNSTIIDPNDYYYSVLEGQKLIVTHFDSEQETEEMMERKGKNSFGYHDNNIKIQHNDSNNSYRKISRDQIKKITKSATRSYNNTENNEIGHMQFTELKNKVFQTILRANNLFSQDNLNPIFKKDQSDVEEEEEDDNNDDYNNNSNQTSNNGESEPLRSRGNAIKNRERTKSHSNQQVISIGNNTSSYNGTKERNLPSLSHTYSNSNTSPNKKIIIEPRAVLNLVDVLKILTQRTVFYTICEDYFHEKVMQRYTISFVYFNAILKQRIFHQIEACAHYKTYYYACSQLFMPFKRRLFVYFVSNCFFKKKVQYMTELLTQTIKKKIIERIYIFGRVCIGEQEQIAFHTLFTRIMSIAMRPMLQVAFKHLINKINANMKIFPIELKSQEKEEESSLPIIEDIIDKDKRLDISNDYSDEKRGSSAKKHNNSNDSYEDESYINRGQAYTYAYESFSEKSEYPVELNSVDSDKLHRLHILIAKQKERMELEGEEEEDDEEIEEYKHSNRSYKRNKDKNDDNLSRQSSNSQKSKKTIEEICKEQPGIVLGLPKKDLEETLRKSLSEKLSDKSFSAKSEYSYKTKKSNRTSRSGKSTPNRESLNKDKEETDSVKRNHYSKNQEKEIKEVSDSYDQKSQSEKLKEDLAMTNKKPSKGDKEIIFKPQDKMNSIEIKEPNLEIIIADKLQLNNSKKKDFAHQMSEQDISVDKDTNCNIEWEISLNGSKPIIEKKDPLHTGNDLMSPNQSYKKCNTKNSEESKEISPIKNYDLIKEENEIVLIKQPNMKENLFQLDILNKEKEKHKDTSSNKSNDLYNDFEKDNIEENINNTEENILNIIQREIKQPKLENKSSIEFLERITEKELNEITDEIFNNLLQSEIKESSIKIIPLKSFSQPMIPIKKDSDSYPNPNTSFPGCNSVSIFFKTVKDKKKEQSFSLYMSKIFPKLVDRIKQEIIKNYNKIYSNLNTPIRSNPSGLMIALSLEDTNLLRSHYKILPIRPSEIMFFSKEKILIDFESTNKKIRSKDNIISDNYYDNMLNDCVIETAIELLHKEREYSDMGEPLPWSYRYRDIEYRYPKDDPKKLAEFIEEQLYSIINHKIGLITEHYDYMEPDQLNMERERKLIKNILNELNEGNANWRNLELEETQSKMEGSKAILDQLLNEVIEILEHIQYSRKRPDLYQNKSIYSCEEIPKLAFQLTSSANEGDEDNELINI